MKINELRVLEFASVLAGPSVGQFFAELGSTVIKIENFRTGGDVTRTWRTTGEQTDDRSAYFCAVNWGKHSIGLDLSCAEGKGVAHRLVKDADIVITSYKPGDATKLGVDYNTLSAINPALIYGHITGYGSDVDHVGYDAVIQAESGFMYMNGAPDGPPMKMPVALMDVLAGHQLKEGLLVALLDRVMSGVGRLVEVSLIQSAIASLVNQGSNWLVGKVDPQRQGSLHPNIAPYGEMFATSDNEYILLAVGTDRQFADLCRLLDHSELADDPRFLNNIGRVRNRKILAGLLAPAFGKKTGVELLLRLKEAKVPAGLIQRVSDALDQQHTKDLLIDDDGLVGVRSFVATGVRLSLHAPPHLGEHTLHILEAAGYSPADIQRLSVGGAIQ